MIVGNPPFIRYQFFKKEQQHEANLIFDRGGTQYIPEFTLKDITFATSGYKYLRGEIDVVNLTINDAVRLRSSTDGNAPFHNIKLSGNWTNAACR